MKRTAQRVLHQVVCLYVTLICWVTIMYQSNYFGDFALSQRYKNERLYRKHICRISEIYRRYIVFKSTLLVKKMLFRKRSFKSNIYNCIFSNIRCKHASFPNGTYLSSCSEKISFWDSTNLYTFANLSIFSCKTITCVRYPSRCLRDYIELCSTIFWQ